MTPPFTPGKELQKWHKTFSKPRKSGGKWAGQISMSTPNSLLIASPIFFDTKAEVLEFYEMNKGDEYAREFSGANTIHVTGVGLGEPVTILPCEPDLKLSKSKVQE